jgi:hypothetical protein
VTLPHPHTLLKYLKTLSYIING